MGNLLGFILRDPSAAGWCLLRKGRYPGHVKYIGTALDRRVCPSLAALRTFDGRESLKVGEQRRDFGHKRTPPLHKDVDL